MNVKILIAIGLSVCLLLLSLMVPVGGWDSSSRNNLEARSNVSMLVFCSKRHYKEYEAFPSEANQGLVETVEENINVVRKFQGNNSKRIIFFPTDRKIELRSKAGAFVDPWGNHYRFAFDTDGDGKIESPYRDDEAVLSESVIVWSVGEDGVLGSKKRPGYLRGADDVVSWR